MDLTLSFDWIKKLGRPSATRDWRIVLAVASAVVVGGTALAVYLFFGVQSGSIIAAASGAPTPPNPVSRAALKQVLDKYRVRKANYDAKSFPAFPVVDPRSSTKK
jgi:hypothetical protein